MKFQFKFTCKFKFKSKLGQRETSTEDNFVERQEGIVHWMSTSKRAVLFGEEDTFVEWRQGIVHWSSASRRAVLFGAEEVGRIPYLEPGWWESSTIWRRGWREGEWKEKGDGLHIRNLTTPTPECGE